MTLMAPLFLLGLLAVGLPLWLHLMQHSNPRTQPFTATFLLRETTLTSATQRRLRYLLLLAARLLLLLLLVLLFVQPALRQTQGATSGDELRRIFLVIDTSLSMRAGTSFAQATTLANELLDQLRAGDRVQLISMGNRLTSLSALEEDLSGVRRQLSQLQPGMGGMDYGTAMQQLNTLLRNAGGRNEVILISDLQASNMPARFAELVPAAAHDMQILPVSGARTNMRLTAALTGSELHVGVAGQRPAGESLDIRLRVNDDDRELVLAPDADSVSLDLDSLRLRPDLNTIRLELIVNDDLAEDNIYHLALDRSVRQRVLVLSSDPGFRDVLFLETALRSLDRPGLEMRRLNAANLSAAELNQIDLVMINDLGALPARHMHLLDAFLQQGGSLVAALGEQSMSLERVPLTGQAIRSQTGLNLASDFQRPLAHNANHPILAATNLGTVSVYRWVDITPAGDDQVIGELPQGSPWLLESTRGNGRLLLFSTPFDTGWSDFPLSPGFPPLLDQAIGELTRGINLPPSLATGASLPVGGMDELGTRQSIRQILDPEGQALVPLAQLGQLRTVQLDKTGIYQLQSSDTTHYLALNTPVVESLLAPLDQNTLQRWRDMVRSSVTPELQASESTAGNPWQTLERWLLPLVVLIILLESLAANAHLWVRRQVRT